MSEARTPTMVVNMRDGGEYDVCIDRRGPWGNPYKVGEDAHCTLGGEIRRRIRDGHDAVEAFDWWVRSSGGPQARWIREHVHELRGKRLGCWCAPKPCHGDVLAELAQATGP